MVEESILHTPKKGGIAILKFALLLSILALLSVSAAGQTDGAYSDNAGKQLDAQAEEDRYASGQGYFDGAAYDSLKNRLENQAKKDEYFSKAKRLEAEGRYDEAVSLYDQAINLDPDNWDNWMAYSNKGEALFKLGRYEEAIIAYNKAIELTPENPIAYGLKGAALKALGRTDESDIAYATARELGDYSAWIPETNATGMNLTSLFHIDILDHSMASDVNESTSQFGERATAFSEDDDKAYSWLCLGHVLGAEVDWHWYSPDGNPYKTGRVEISRNQSGGFWSSYNVWYPLDIAAIPNEPYMSGDWHVDIYINGKKRLTDQFALSVHSDSDSDSDSNSNSIDSDSTHSRTDEGGKGNEPNPGLSAANGTFTVLDHAMAGEIDQAVNRPVTTTISSQIRDTLLPHSWLQISNIGVARIKWIWKGGGGYEITHTYEIPPNPEGGYYATYNVWDSLDIPSMLLDFQLGEIDEGARRSSAEIYAESQGSAYYYTNSIPDPRGDWTVDVYLNDQWLLQEQFAVISG